jgi:hypothetical protein
MEYIQNSESPDKSEEETKVMGVNNRRADLIKTLALKESRRSHPNSLSIETLNLIKDYNYEYAEKDLVEDISTKDKVILLV